MRRQKETQLPAVIKPLRPKQIAFEYMKDRNATQAYIRAGYSANGAQPSSAALLSNPMVSAEVARRAEEYTKTTGIETVKILEFFRDAMFADVTRLFEATGKLLLPSHWPEHVKKLVTSYNAGTVTTAEKITLADRIQLGFKLLESLKNVAASPAITNLTNNIQVNAEQALIELRAAIAG